MAIMKRPMPAVLPDRGRLPPGVAPTPMKPGPVMPDSTMPVMPQPSFKPNPGMGATPVMPQPSGLGKPFKKGGSVSSASKRADGIAQRGKTRGQMR